MGTHSEAEISIKSIHEADLTPIFRDMYVILIDETLLCSSLLLKSRIS